jgi:hypothetical protein
MYTIFFTLPVCWCVVRIGAYKDGWLGVRLKLKALALGLDFGEGGQHKIQEEGVCVWWGQLIN